MSVIISQTHKPANNAWYAKNTVPKLLIEATENVTVTLYYKDQEAQEWESTDIAFKGSYSPDFNGEIWVDFEGVYDNFISTQLPDGSQDSIVQDKAWYYFRAVVTDSAGNNVGTAITWRVFNAKLKSAATFGNWSSNNFLTNQPVEKLTNYESPEWLTWLDKSSGTSLVARFYPKNGGNVDVQVFTATDGGCVSVNVRYSRLIRMANVLPSQLKGYYDLILIEPKNDTEVCRQRYIYKERSGMEKYYCFVNALGGVDTMICDGENVLQPDTAHNIGRFGDHYRALDDTDDQRKWSQNTGMMPTRYRNWVYELLTAKQGAEKYDPEAMNYYEIVVESSDVAMGDYGQLSSAAFGYILTETVNVMHDTERAVGRMLHQSIAEQAEELDDMSKSVEIAFETDGQSGFETEEIEIGATKLYVSAPRTYTTAGELPVYYFIDGSDTAAGSFVPGTNPSIITKGKDDSIRFATQNDAIGSLIINYY